MHCNLDLGAVPRKLMEEVWTMAPIIEQMNLKGHRDFNRGHNLKFSVLGHKLKQSDDYFV